MASKHAARMIDEFPKAELHLHIEGTFEPELLFRISKRNRIPLKYGTLPEVKKAYSFTDLGSFLEIYYNAMSVLKESEDFLRADQGVPTARGRGGR